MMSLGGRMLGVLIGFGTLAAACGGGDSSLDGEWMPEEAELIIAASAEAMGAVTSVRFDLQHSGASVYIDPVESLALQAVIGRFIVPDEADALVTVNVNDNLKTELGAVAVGPDVWMSNPITGKFEPLPVGYNIDPRTFFDPRGGWQPLLADITDPVFVAVEDNRYHLTGTATAAQIEIVTAGLVSGTDVAVDLWIHPVTAVVTRVEFPTDAENGRSDWVLELSEYGEEFSIVAPDVDG